MTRQRYKELINTQFKIAIFFTILTHFIKLFALFCFYFLLILSAITDKHSVVKRKTFMTPQQAH